jgi:glycine/D-amino acid oxidase-like deaminating enzyme
MPHPVLDEIDVVIIGGGIVGSCLAGFLAEEGLGVAVIDDGRIGGTNANGRRHQRGRPGQLFPRRQ